MTAPIGCLDGEQAIRDALAAGPLKGVWIAERDFSQWRISNGEIAKNRSPRRVAGVGSPGRLKTSHLETENAATAGFIAACNPVAISALLAELDRLRSASRQEGWQPIADAPKEKVFSDEKNSYGPILLLWPDRFGSVVRGRWWWHSDGSSNFLADGGMATFPTHWQFLPTPPQEAQGDRHGE